MDQQDKAWLMMICGVVGLIANIIGFFLFRRPKRHNDSADRRSLNAGSSEEILEVLPAMEEGLQTAPGRVSLRRRDDWFDRIPEPKRGSGFPTAILVGGGVVLGGLLLFLAFIGFWSLVSVPRPAKTSLVVTSATNAPVQPVAPATPKPVEMERKPPPIYPPGMKPEPILPIELAGPDISKDWIVLFRSHDPAIWNREVNQTPSHFARPIASVPDGISHLRIRKNEDYVIIAMTKSNLLGRVDTRPFGWEGSNHRDSGAYHLGIFDVGKPATQRGLICIRILPWYGGWGFGHRHFANNVQGYCWNGEPIPPVVFELAVKSGPLTPLETKRLLK